MPKLCCVSMLAALALVLSGCGQKGPLRRPDVTSLFSGPEVVIAAVR